MSQSVAKKYLKFKKKIGGKGEKREQEILKKDQIILKENSRSSKTVLILKTQWVD